MLQYATSSWHYKLVYYVFGKSFFFETDLDHEKIRKQRTILEDKTRKEFPNDDKILEKKYQEFHMNVFGNDSFMKYTENKTTSFCPYCRAVLTSLIIFPFVALYKLIPKKEPKQYNREEAKERMERRSKIIRVICGGFNIALGIKNIVLDNSIEVGIIQIGIGIGLMFLFQTAVLFRKIYSLIYSCYKKIKNVLINLHILKVKTKRIPKAQKSKTPNFVQAFFSENHSKYCPPVAFVDETDR